jgi:expansin (peptidoglycan-binding protein)
MKFHHQSFIILALFSSPMAQPDSGNIIHSGQATYYAATGDGNCMFGPSPSDLMVCAMNNTEYDSSSVCGASIHVKGRLGEVTVRIVDRCPECPVGNIDMSPQAFAKIDDTIRGRVPVTWWYVESQVTGPIQYRVKTGSNAWWIGIQILNHRTPVVKLEALYNGVWVTIPRMNYNYFVYASGLGPGPFTLRVTDFYGQQLVDANIPLSPDVKTNGQANFSSHAAVSTHIPHGIIEDAPHPVIVTKIGSLKGMMPGRYDVFTVKGIFVGRITIARDMKTANIDKTAKNGVFIIRPVGVIKQ